MSFVRRVYFWHERWHCHLQSRQIESYWTVSSRSNAARRALWLSREESQGMPLSESFVSYRRNNNYITQNCIVLGELFWDLHFTGRLKGLRRGDPFCRLEGQDAALFISEQWWFKCQKTYSLPKSRVWRLSPITAFFDPHTWTLVQLGFFDSWSRKLCFQKCLHLSTFLVPNAIVFEGFAILPSRIPANIFQALNRGTDRAN